MKCRLLNLLTVLSLLLCGALVAMWYTGDIYYFGSRPRWSITAEQGTLVVQRGYDRGWETEVHWPLLVGLLLPAVRVIRRRTRVSVGHSRQRNGLCAACRYDLTGNVSGVCPECGGALRADPSR